MLGSIIPGPAKLSHCELCPTPIPKPLPLFLWLPRLALFLVSPQPSVLTRPSCLTFLPTFQLLCELSLCLLKDRVSYLVLPNCHLVNRSVLNKL